MLHAAWGPAAASAADSCIATTTRPFSMPLVRWFSTPSLTSVVQGRIFSTVR